MVQYLWILPRKITELGCSPKNSILAERWILRGRYFILWLSSLNKADCCVKQFWTFELWEFKVKSRLNFSTEIVLWPILLTTYYEQGRLVEIVNNLTIIESNQKLTKNVETLPGKTVVIWVAWNHFKNMIYFKRKMIFWVTLWISQPARLRIPDAGRQMRICLSNIARTKGGEYFNCKVGYIFRCASIS